MIVITYKCKCMKEPKELPVPARFEGEDIGDYMSYVIQPALYLDHRTHSPTCREDKMEFCAIPIEKNRPLGEEGPKQ